MKNEIGLGWMTFVPFWDDGVPEGAGGPCGFRVEVADTGNPSQGQVPLRWGFHGGKLLQKNVCKRIDIKELKRSGLHKGFMSTIEGLPFLVRLPYMDSEWPMYEADCWNIPYWAISKDGYPDIVHPELVPSASYGTFHVRLVLEPQPVDLRSFVEREARLLLPGAILDAEILELNAYDLACRRLDWHAGQVSSKWGKFASQKLYINREAVLTAAAI